MDKRLYLQTAFLIFAEFRRKPVSGANRLLGPQNIFVISDKGVKGVNCRVSGYAGEQAYAAVKDNHKQESNHHFATRI